MGKLLDITPQHNPITLSDEFKKVVEGGKAKAAFFAVIDEDDELIYAEAAFQGRDLLWLVELIKKDLMESK